jgi:hypothetical protein
MFASDSWAPVTCSRVSDPVHPRLKPRGNLQASAGVGGRNHAQETGLPHRSGSASCQAIGGQTMTDGVDKVRGMSWTSNNRIIGVNFLNRTCAFDTHCESILLRDPPNSTASTLLFPQTARSRPHRRAGIRSIGGGRPRRRGLLPREWMDPSTSPGVGLGMAVGSLAYRYAARARRRPLGQSCRTA